MYRRKRRKDFVYEKLRESILSGDIPAQTSLSERSLAEKLGVSRTPVREAVLMLEADGLVKMYPNKGPVVSRIGIEDIIWITQIREGLEGIAARIACRNVDQNVFFEIQEKLLSIAGLNSEEDIKLSYAYGREIHKVMLDSSNNRRMIKIVENMTDQLEHIMELSTLAPQRAELTYEQHLAMLGAFINGDEDEAERQVRIHINSVTTDAIKTYHQKCF